MEVIRMENIYGINELNTDDENTSDLKCSNYCDIVTYRVPDIEYGSEIRLYGIAKDVLDTTLNTTYDVNGHLKMLTISRNSREELLYIYYEK